MECNLCEKTIDSYNEKFNHFVIDKNHSINVCPECVEKFIKWQKNIITVLFPTKMLKKYGKSSKKD